MGYFLIGSDRFDDAIDPAVFIRLMSHSSFTWSEDYRRHPTVGWGQGRGIGKRLLVALVTIAHTHVWNVGDL